MQAARSLVADTAGTDVVLILPTIWLDRNGLHNAVLVAEKGEVIADGSSTVGPLTEVAGELFKEENSELKGAIVAYQDALNTAGVDAGYF